MRRPVGLGHWLVLVFLLLLVALPTAASAVTTVRVFPASPYLDERLTALPPPPVVVGAHALVRPAGAPGYPAAGVQGTSPGLQGTTVALAACAGTCTHRYRPASTPAIPAAHYLERILFTVTQPGRAGTAVGFDVEAAVHLTTGWVFGMGYFSTGRAFTLGTSTIRLFLYVDLGAALPTVLSVEVVDNRCLSTTACP
jgi:hypothetical protein